MIGVTLHQMKGKDVALLIAACKGRAAILVGFVAHLATSVSIAEQRLQGVPV